MVDGAKEPRFVVTAPVGRDGELIRGLLSSAGYSCELRAKIDAWGANTDDWMGIIVTDEALTPAGIEALRAIVQKQPAWSDLPILLLSSGTTEPNYAMVASQVRMELRSVFLLDRPVRKELLLSAVEVAHQARMRQLEVRDAANRQTLSEEALRNSEKLAIAGQLAATMAHEINNPLEALGNLLYLTECAGSVEEAHALSRIARNELQRISEIVDHTLRFQRGSAKPSCTDMGELASSALTLFRGKIRQRQIVAEFKADKVEAYCSEGELRQAFVNLIGNAVDAMPNGGRLAVRVSAVSVKGSRCARVTIADSGGGISQQVRSRLFTQFFTTKGSRGTGIGLWLTKDIVQRNRGILRFRSRTNTPSGTVFSIYLPASAQPEVVHPEMTPAGVNGKRAEEEAA